MPIRRPRADADGHLFAAHSFRAERIAPDGGSGTCTRFAARHGTPQAALTRILKQQVVQFPSIASSKQTAQYTWPHGSSATSFSTVPARWSHHAHRGDPASPPATASCCAADGVPVDGPRTPPRRTIQPAPSSSSLGSPAVERTARVVQAVRAESATEATGAALIARDALRRPVATTPAAAVWTPGVEETIEGARPTQVGTTDTVGPASSPAQ